MMGSHGMRTYIYLHVDFYGFHVGKYTSPIDPLGLSIFLYTLKNRFSKLLSLQVVLQKISDKYTSPRLDLEFSHPVAFKRVVGTLFLPVPVCDSSRSFHLPTYRDLVWWAISISFRHHICWASTPAMFEWGDFLATWHGELIGELSPKRSRWAWVQVEICGLWWGSIEIYIYIILFIYFFEFIYI